MSVGPTGHARRVLPRDRFAVCLAAAFRVVFLVAFLTLAADFDADFLAVRPAGFLLLDFLAADLRPTDWLAAFFERLARGAPAFEAFDFLALAFVALATVAVRRAFAARFRRGGAAATGGAISGSETRPSAASGT